MPRKRIYQNLELALLASFFAACMGPGRDPDLPSQDPPDEEPSTPPCADDGGRCGGQQVSGFAPGGAPPITRDVQWLERLPLEVDETSGSEDTDDADARERVESPLFPPTSVGALLTAHLDIVGSFAVSSAVDYEESIERVRSAQPAAGALLLDTYEGLEPSDRRDRLWILHTLSELEDERALRLFERVASDRSLPEAKARRRYGARTGELVVRSFAVLGLRRLAGAGMDEAVEALVRLVESSELPTAVRHRAVDALLDLGISPRGLELSTDERWVFEVERADEPPTITDE